MPFNEIYTDHQTFVHSNSTHQQPATLLIQDVTQTPTQTYHRSFSSLSDHAPRDTERHHNNRHHHHHHNNGHNGHNGNDNNNHLDCTIESSQSQNTDNRSTTSSSLLPDPWFNCDRLRWIPQRHLVLFAFCVNSASNAFHWVQYTVLNDLIIKQLGMSQQLVNFTSLVYMIVYTLGAMPASHIQERYGLRLAIFLGTALTLLGSLIKCLTVGLDVVQAIILGQTVISVAQLFVLGIPSHLAAVWYPQSQQNTATAVAVFANSFGVAASFLIPPLAISADTFGPDLHRLHANLACLAAVSQLLVMLFVCSSPGDYQTHASDSPDSVRTSLSKEMRTSGAVGKPSTERESASIASSSALRSNRSQVKEDKFIYASDAPGNHPHQRHLAFWDVFKRLTTHPHFVLLFFTYGISMGISSAFATCLPRLLERPESTDSASEISQVAGQLGVVYIISGLVGMLVTGRLLDRGRRYKLSAILLNAGACFGFVQTAWLVRYGYDYRLLFPSVLLVGYCWLALLMMGYEFAAEITYPLPESVSAAMLNIGSNVFGIMAIELGELLLDQYGVWTCNMVYLLIMVLMTLLSCFITDRLPRQAAYELFEKKADLSESEENVSILAVD